MYIEYTYVRQERKDIQLMKPSRIFKITQKYTQKTRLQDQRLEYLSLVWGNIA